MVESLEHFPVKWIPHFGEEVRKNNSLKQFTINMIGKCFKPRQYFNSSGDRL